MPQISTQAFKVVPLRVHSFLADVPLHDAWVVELPRVRPGITLNEFLRTPGVRLFALSPAAQAILNLRFLLGRVFGWDREPATNSWEPFSTRLTTEDQSKSLAPAGEREGHFRMVYRFENEQLLELANRTVHAAALSALLETPNTYRFYLGIYVCSVGWLTPLYMAMISPFRKLIVYPSLLRSVQTAWNHAFPSM